MEDIGKILILIIDGIGDRGVPALDNQSPLMVAEHPNLDWYASRGTNGIMDPISPGVRAGSDTSHLSLLGYDPGQVYTGRGPFEAAGIGLMGGKGDVAFRCNFATVDDDWKVIDRRAGRIKEPDTGELLTSFEGMEIEGVEVSVKDGTEHRAALLLSGPGLSPHVTDVDPHRPGPTMECKALVPEAETTARIVNQFVEESHRLMKNHPVNERRRDKGSKVANILLPRGAGEFPDIPSFKDKFGLESACIAGVGLIKGICRTCGMEVIEDEKFTGGLDTDMVLKAETALGLLEEKDLVMINVKAPDLAGHDGDYEGKIESIERVDHMAGVFRESLPAGVTLAITADHCTPVVVRDHSGDPVPLTIISPSSLSDSVKEYNEISNAVGALGRIRGGDLLPSLMDRANRSEKFGA